MAKKQSRSVRARDAKPETRNSKLRRWRWVPCLLGALVLAACSAGPSTPRAESGPAPGQAQPREPGRVKAINLALTTIIDGFSIAASSTTAGGGLSYIEIHSAALVTADKVTGRPIGRLAAEAPNLDNRGLAILPDGRMTATYGLRRDATWHDGAPVTTRDLLLTYTLAKNPTIPIIDSGPTKLMESVATPDDHTFVITFRQPYYLADSLGLRAFWPLPAHILQAEYDRLDTAAFLNLPFWTTQYIHAGPFKLAQFVPGTELVFEAYDKYFLGPPKVDRIVVKQFADDNLAYASVLAGAIDMGTEGVLSAEKAFELKELWDAAGGGSVYIGTGNIGFISVQFDSSVADYQPALQDRRVRQALYTGIDRAAYADVAIPGHPERAADAILPNDDPLYPYVKGGMDRYTYDPNRASAILQEAGWRRGADGTLVNAAGSRFTLLIRGTSQTAPVVVDMWKKLGVDAREYEIPAHLSRDRAFRSQFPGVEITARGSRDSILTRVECAEIPTAQNAYSGNNRGKWCIQQYEDLVTRYRGSLRLEERGQIMRQIQDLIVAELPYLVLQVGIAAPFARRGVTAFRDDFAGGSDAGRIYGTHSRNAHEWDVVPY